MADYETTYNGVLGAVVDAINAAWSPAKIIVFPEEKQETYSAYPVAYIQPQIVEVVNETPTNDQAGVMFTIAGIFETDDVNGAHLLGVAKWQLAQAQLYAATNLGGFAYNGLFSPEPGIELEGNSRVVVVFNFTCNISYSRR